MRELSAAGVPVGLSLAPVIPGLTDHELERIVEAAAGSGARDASWILLRLPHDVKALFEGWLETHYPARKERVLSLLRQCREGRLLEGRQPGRRGAGLGVEDGREQRRPGVPQGLGHVGVLSGVFGQRLKMRSSTRMRAEP